MHGRILTQTRWRRAWLGVVAAACHPAPSVWWEVAVAGCRPAPDAWWEVAVAACHPAPSVWWEVGAAGCHRGGLRAERKGGGSRQRRTDHGPANPVRKALPFQAQAKWFESFGSSRSPEF